MSPQGETTPIGVRPNIRLFHVDGIFESGFFEIDDNWAYASLEATQKALQDVVTQMELKVDDLNQAPGDCAQVEEAVDHATPPPPGWSATSSCWAR